MKLSLFIASLIISANAFGLSAENCSNADGSVMRIEKEVWGANPIEWQGFINQKKVKILTHKWDESTAKILSEEKKIVRGLETKIRTYAKVVEITYIDDAADPKVATPLAKRVWMICQAYENDARD